MYQNVYYESRKNRVHIWDDKNGHVVVPYKRYAYVKDSYGTHVSLYGDKLKKLYHWKKGTSGLYESDINCAIREFEEETGIEKSKYNCRRNRSTSREPPFNDSHN